MAKEVADMAKTIARAKRALEQGEMTPGAFIAMLRKIGWTLEPEKG